MIIAIDGPAAAGKVEMTDVHTRESIELLPGRQAVCDRQTGNVEVKEVDTELFTAWIRGEFRFDNTSVEEIFTILQRWYHIDVFYTNDAVRFVQRYNRKQSERLNSKTGETTVKQD